MEQIEYQLLEFVRSVYDLLGWGGVAYGDRERLHPLPQRDRNAPRTSISR